MSLKSILNKAVAPLLVAGATMGCDNRPGTLVIVMNTPPGPPPATAVQPRRQVIVQQQPVYAAPVVCTPSGLCYNATSAFARPYYYGSNYYGSNYYRPNYYGPRASFNVNVGGGQRFYNAPAPAFHQGAAPPRMPRHR